MRTRAPVVIHSVGEHRGLFSYLTSVLALLEKYGERGVPVYVDWSGAGNYADPARGANVFEYFFEQPMVPALGDHHEVIEDTEGRHILAGFFNGRIYGFDPGVRSRVSRLVAKYLRIRPAILEKAEAFRARALTGRVLAVHVRATDMYAQGGHLRGQSLPLDAYLDCIDRALHGGGHTRIFAASDDARVIAFLRDNYRNLVTYASIRSGGGQALHLDAATTGYQIGEDVLVESLLLSRCQFLVASPSNVSTMATFWNPELPFVSALEGIVRFPPTF